MSSRGDGLWWALDDNNTNAQVFIANTRTTQSTVTPVFYVGGAAYEGDPMVLNGHESDAIDIKQTLNTLHVPGDTTVGGISLMYTNGPGGLAMVGVISDKQTGFSTTMRFIDQHSQHTTTLHGANIPIGRPEPTSGFASTVRFTPHVVVRNNTDQPAQIQPRIRYLVNDQPHVINLTALTLSPNQVRELNLSSAIDAIGNNVIQDSGIEIEHAGNPGAVMAYAASIDQSGSNVLDAPIKDPTGEMGFKGGSYPWDIEGDNRAVLHIKNVDAPGDGQKRQAMAKLYFDGGEYNLPLQEMDAGQTVEVDIKKLRDDQVKDVLGNVIPLTVTGGQLDWNVRANKGQFIGRLIEYNPVTGVAASFSCVGDCPCNSTFQRGEINPGVIQGFFADTFGLASTETDIDCNGQNTFTFDVGPSEGLQYFSSNESVVTVSGNTATLVGAGSADITANWDALNVTTHCFFTAEGDCNEARCDTSQVGNPLADILANVLAVDFLDVTVVGTNRTASFILNSANLNPDTPDGPAACSGDTFFIKARFLLPRDSIDCCGDLETFVSLSSDNKFQLLDWQFAQNADKKSGFVVIKLKKRSSGGTTNSINISVGGTYGDHSSYRGQGTVHLICP